MNNKIILGIIGLVVIGGVAVFAMSNTAPSDVATNAGVYCGSNGTLTDAMPIQSHRSYCMKTNSDGKTYSVNAPNEYSFSIVDDQGNTLKNFEITHTKPMHVIVVRKDLANFQHVHPEFSHATGVFTLKDLRLPADGMYRIFADFAPTGGAKNSNSMPLPVTISEDVSAGTGANYTPVALKSAENDKTFGDYQVSLSFDQPPVSGKEVAMSFSLKQNSKPITDLEEYLGALGHSVILRENDLDFIHAHPMEDVNRPQTGEVSFMVDFPEAGKYKVFTQFQRDGKVFTTDFVVPVTQNSKPNDSSERTMMHGGDSMH